MAITFGHYLVDTKQMFQNCFHSYFTPLLFRYRGVVFVLEGEEFVESRTGSVELRVITVFDDGAVIHDVDTVHAA